MLNLFKRSKSHMIYVTYSVPMGEGKRSGIFHMTVPKSLSNTDIIDVMVEELGVSNVTLERIDVVGKNLMKGGE